MRSMSEKTWATVSRFNLTCIHSQYLTYRSISEVWVTSFKLSSKLKTWISDFSRSSVNWFKKRSKPMIYYIHWLYTSHTKLLSNVSFRKHIAAKVSFKWSFERNENPLRAGFSVQILSAFVEAVSVLREDSIVCCCQEVGTWFSDSTSTASAPSTVVCITKWDFFKKLRTFFKASLGF